MGNDADSAPCVLFDLDGTLVDSAPGIVDCLAATLRTNGHPVHDAGSLKRFVGPPVADTIRDLTGLSDVGVARAVRDYRDLYAERGIQNSAVYPGIFGLLVALQELGVGMGVATSKRESHASAMLTNHGLTGFFSVVAGADEQDAHSTKTEVLASGLARLESSGLDISRTWYVGDRTYDVAGGIAVGVPVIFASWGYGGIDESAGAIATSDSPSRLLKILTSLWENIGRNVSL